MNKLIYAVGLLVILCAANPSFSYKDDDDPEKTEESEQSESKDAFDTIQDGVKESVETVRDSPYQIMKPTIDEEFRKPIDSEEESNSEESENSD